MTVDRSVLPAVGPSIGVRFPDVRRETLANGLRVWTVERRELPIVAVLALIETGAVDDPEDRPGLAALVADLLDEGARGRNAVEFHDAVARIGGQLDTEAAHDSTIVHLLALAPHRADALALVGDLLFAPNLAAADFDRVRELRLNRLAQLRDVPSATAERVLAERLYGRHPYGHLPLGTEEALRALTLDEVAAFHLDRYTPQQVTLVIVGDLSHDTATAAAERVFGGFAGGGTPAAAVQRDIDRVPTPVRAPTIVLVDRPKAPQSELRIGRVAAPRATPDFFPMIVLNAILGGQFVSRINMKLREEKGYTYGARSSFEFRRGPGPFVVQASVQTDATADAVHEVFREVEDIRSDRPVSPAELEFGRASLTRGFARNFETAEQLARAAAQLRLYGLEASYFDRFVEHVEAVDVESVTRAALQWLTPDNLVVVVVGDRSRVEEPLRSLGLGEVVTVN